MSRLLSVNAGLPRDVTWNGKTVRSQSGNLQLTDVPLVWRKLIILLTCHEGRPGLAIQSHSRVAGLPPLGIVSLPVCLNWRKHATFRSDGRAGLESVIPA